MPSAPELRTFWPSGRIVAGAGAIAQLPELTRPYGATAVIVDRHVSINPALSEALRILAPTATYAYSGAEPSVQGVEEAAAACAGAGVVVAVGGGSTIDLAKAATIRTATDMPLERFEGAERIDVDLTPLIAAPTTAGTGSEVTGSCVLESADGVRKLSIRSHRLVPSIAVLDPALLATTPRSIIAASGIDAFAHAVEAFCSTRASAITDVLALGAIRVVSKHLPRYYRDPSDGEAAAAVGTGACMAGMAFNSARVGLAHAIASAIGPMVHLPHGVCVSLGLPLALRLNAPVLAPERLASLLEAMGARPTSDPAASAERHVRELMRELDLPQTASQAGRHFAIAQPLVVSIIQSGRLDTNPAVVPENVLYDLLQEING